MPVPAYCQPSAYQALRDEIASMETPVGLVRAACAIAAHEAGVLETDRTLESLNALVRTVEHRSPSKSQDALIANLHDVLFDVIQLTGNVDDYYNPENSYLPNVVTSRRGLPITLSLVYYYVACELGLEAHGVNSPGHFMVAVETTEGSQPTLMFVDPFYGGSLLSLPEAFERIMQATGKFIEPDPRLLAPASHQDWLRRILLNLIAIFARNGRERDLHAMQEMLSLVEGNHVE